MGAHKWHPQSQTHFGYTPAASTLIEQLQLGDEAAGETGYGLGDRKARIIAKTIPLDLVHLLQALLHRGFGSTRCILHVLNQYEGIVFQLLIVGNCQKFKVHCCYQLSLITLTLIMQ